MYPEVCNYPENDHSKVDKWVKGVYHFSGGIALIIVGGFLNWMNQRLFAFPSVSLPYLLITDSSYTFPAY